MQSFISPVPHLTTRRAPPVSVCPLRKPLAAQQSGPQHARNSPGQSAAPRRRGRPTKSSTSQLQVSKVHTPPPDPTTDPSVSDPGNTSQKDAKKRRGTQRKKASQHATELNKQAKQDEKEEHVSDNASNRHAKQRKGQSNMSNTAIKNGSLQPTTGQTHNGGEVGGNGDKVNQSHATVVSKQNRARENATPVTKAGLEESTAVGGVAQKNKKNWSPATGPRNKSQGKSETEKLVDNSPKSRMNRVNKKNMAGSGSPRQSGPRRGRKGVGRSREVVNALDLEMGMPDEVPLVPISALEETSKTRKTTGAALEKRQRKEHVPEKPKADAVQASTVDDSAQTKEETEEPQASDIVGEVDLGAGLHDSEIARIRDIAASSEALKKQMAASKSGNPSSASIPASRTAIPRTEEERKQAAQASFRDAEKMVEEEVEYYDGRYGTCFQCGEAIVIPGLAQFFCKNCGWLSRAVETKTISPGHHD